MEHIRIDEKLIIHIPESLKTIPQFNHNVQTYTIDCPRYTQNGEDMLEMVPFISVEKKGIKEPLATACSTPIKDETDDNIIHFNWTIKREVTDTVGKIGIVVCVRRSEEENLENAWHTYRNEEIEIKKGIDCGLDMMMQYPGLIEEMLYRLGIVEKTGGAVTDETLTISGAPADAKVVGDKFGKLTDAVEDLKENGGSGSIDVCPYEEVNSIEEMTDTSKKYLMNGYIYSRVATSGVEVPNYNNLAVITDTDKRLNSSGTTTALTGNAVTDWIECNQGDVFRVKGLDILEQTGGYAQMYTTKAADSAKPSGYASHFTTGADGVIRFTIATWISTETQPNITKMRFSGKLTGSADDVIITKNEEIANRVTDGTYEWIKGEKWTGSYSGSTSGGTVTEDVAIPSYWKSHLDSKISTVKALQDAVGDELVSFPFFTDLHCNANQSYNLGRNVGLLSNEIMNRCDIPFVVCGGDTNSNGNLSTKDAVETCIENAMEIFAPIKDRLLLARGNHDITYGGTSADGNTYRWQYSPSELYNKLFRWQSTDFRRVLDVDSDGTYFYVDDKAHKTRFIVLDSQWVEWQGRNADGSVKYNAHHNSGYGQKQLEWLSNKALQFDESGWLGVIVTHVPPTSVTYNGSTRNYLNETRDGVIFKEIVIAFCNKTGYTGTYTGTEEWQNVDITVDFTSRNGNVACILSGHCHVDRIIEDELPCPIITFTASSNMPRTGEESVTRTFGTVNETAFDIVSIDRVNRKIYMTRVGIGEDRECTYSEEVAPNTLIPTVTIDFTDEELAEMGGYSVVTSKMFNPHNRYKVMWDGKEYILHDVFVVSSDEGTLHYIGNSGYADGEYADDIPFVIGTAEIDGVVLMVVFDYAYTLGETLVGIHTFSVEEIVDDGLPLYHCHLESTIIGDSPFKLLKGIEPLLLKKKDRNISLNGHLYTSNFVKDIGSGDSGVFLTRIYCSDLVYLHRETILFTCSEGELVYRNTFTSKVTMTDTKAEQDF